MKDKQPGSRRKAVTRSVRMSEEEHALFGEFCDSLGVTPSEALRRLARSAALLGPTFTGEARADIIALTRQMRAVGNNLNQAVHHMNAGHVIQSDDMKGHLEAVSRAIGELDRLYRSLCVKSYRRTEAAVAGRSQ
ncbi:MAG: plasmid mobilization relaxosome protein MobC [Methylocystis sp.]|jgi:negative regulator of replication initiation